jgi:sugar phosphate permease
MWTPVIAVVQRWFSVRKRGLALGVLSTGYGLGFATMGAVFPLIVSAFNWRFAWYFLGAAALVMVLFNALLLRSDPESAGHRPWGDQGGIDSKETPDGNESIPWKKVFQYKSFWIIGLSYFCIAYSLYGVTTFMVDFATDQVGLPLQRASFLATIHGMCQIIGVLTILPLSDYLGRKRTILISNAVITFTLAGILFAGHSWVMLYFLVGLQGVFYGVTFPIYGACAGDYFPRRLMATVIGAWTPFYGIGAILSHWVCGMLRDVTGTYSMAFGTNALMAAAGFCLMILFKGEKMTRAPTTTGQNS